MDMIKIKDGDKEYSYSRRQISLAMWAMWLMGLITGATFYWIYLNI